MSDVKIPNSPATAPAQSESPGFISPPVQRMNALGGGSTPPMKPNIGAWPVDGKMSSEGTGVSSAPLQMKTGGGGCGCPTCAGGGAAQRKVTPNVSNAPMRKEAGVSTSESQEDSAGGVVTQKQNAHDNGCNCPSCAGTVQKKAMDRVPAMQLKTAPSGSGVVQRAEGDTTYYYATATSNVLRMKTADNKFQPMNEGKVKKGGATQLDPAAEFAPKTGEGVTIAEGTAGTWYVNPDNSKVALFKYGGQEAWVEAGKLSGSVVDVKTNDRVEIVGNFNQPLTGADGQVVLEVKWGNYQGYTAKSNIEAKVFNTKYSTPVGGAAGGRELEYNQGAYRDNEVTYEDGKKTNGKESRRRSRDYYVKNAPNAVISVETSKNLNKLPKVNNAKALIKVWNETTQSFDNGDGKLNFGEPVVIKEEKLVSEKKGETTVQVWYAKVVTSAGSEVWTWAGNEPRKANVKGNLTMESFSAGSLDSFTNSVFRAALADAYTQNVLEMLNGKSGFSADQKHLFEEAVAFKQDGNAQAKVSSTVNISADNLSKEGNTLNQDLIDRVKLFHKFMVSKDLVRSASVTVSDGVRSAAEAHKWSTAYNIRNGGVGYAAIKALTGGMDLDGNLWYDPASDEVFKEVPLEGKELEDELAKQKADPKYKPKTTKTVLDEAGTMAKIKVRASGHWSGSQAAEGYPVGSEKRKPNNDSQGISNHVSGNAIDITIPFKFNYYDPVIDGLAAIFGLFRAVKDASSAEHWHYERVGAVVPGQVTSSAEHQNGGK